MALARNLESKTQDSIILHRATKVFADSLVPGVNQTYTKSKPLGVKECSKGSYDMCIGSTEVIQKFDNLEIMEKFKPEMVWTLYERR